MNTQHWIYASVMAIGLHIFIAYSVVTFNSSKKETILFERSGEGISVNLSSYAIPPQSAAEKLDIPVKELPIKQAFENIHPKKIEPSKVEQKKNEPKKTIKPSKKAKIKAQNKPKKNSIPVKTTQFKQQIRQETTPKITPRQTPAENLLSKNINKDQRAETTQTKSASTAQKKQTAQVSVQQKKASNQYFNKIMRRLLMHKKYPHVARRKKQEGIVKIQFTLDKNGNIIQKSIRESSGFEKLDAAAIKMLMKANPLPAIPKSMNKETINIVIPVDYSLK